MAAADWTFQLVFEAPDRAFHVEPRRYREEFSLALALGRREGKTAAFGRAFLGFAALEPTQDTITAAPRPKSLPTRLARPLVELLMRSSAFSAFVAAAPGARELVTATKSWELGRSGALGRGNRWSSRPGYDVVVLDAPASGHGLALLSTPRTFADIARVGPVAVQARRAAELLEHPSRTGLISVARAEETPVNETLEFGARSQAVLGHGPALIAVSAVHGAGLRTAERELVLAGDGAVPAAVVGAIRTRAARTRVQDTQLARLRRQADAPVVTLPFVTGPISAVDVELLARKLGPALAAG